MMRLLHNTSIKQRLTSLIMSISFISVVLTTLAISIFGIFNLRADIINDLEVWAVIGGDRNAAALTFIRPDQATEHLKDFSAKQTLVQACLYDKTGTFFANYVNYKYPGSKCPLDLRERVLIGTDRIELMKPIVNLGDKVGYIYLE